MKARMKRRRTMRRLTILVSVAAVGASLAVGVYVAAMAGSPLEAYVGKDVPAPVYNSLYAESRAPYGDIGSSFLSRVQSFSGTHFKVDGKPLLVYVGADFCPYCAIQRWSIVLSLMRFGNFTGLQFMVPPPREGLYPTFTFTEATYHSNYVAFQAFELQDRDSKDQEALPSNYSSAFQAYGSSYPFMNFGGYYVIRGSLVTDPSILSNKNWTQVISSIGASDSLGTQVRRAANVMTGVLCALTDNVPASVCATSPIQSVVIGLGGPTNLSLQVVSVSFSTPHRHG